MCTQNVFLERCRVNDRPNRMISPHCKKRPNCPDVVNKVPKAVEKHWQGKRFQKGRVHQKHSFHDPAGERPQKQSRNILTQTGIMTWKCTITQSHNLSATLYSQTLGRDEHGGIFGSISSNRSRSTTKLSLKICLHRH